VLLIGKNTTVEQIFRILEALGLVPTEGKDQFYFTHRGQKIEWTDTMESLGAGPLSHLFLTLIVPGGAKRAHSASPLPSKKKAGAKSVNISGSYFSIQKKTLASSDSEEEEVSRPKPRHKPVRFHELHKITNILPAFSTK
jgi:hypothetical protein